MKKNLTKKELNERFNDPVIRNQAIGNQFTQNEDGEVELLGDFIGEKGYISFEDVVRNTRESNKKIILNIGDSSTTGWNSEVQNMNLTLKEFQKQKKNEEIFPLWTYKTYSDITKDLLDEKYIVINAGVPTHTTFNAQKRLKKLLAKFENAKIKINFVTLYIGNNDCACNGNLEEKYQNSKLQRVLLEFRRNKIIHRTSKIDFAKNIQNIIETCRLKNISLVIIKPIIPIYWEPGRAMSRRPFVKYDFLDSLFDEIKISNPTLYQSYKESLHLWNQGISEHHSGNIDQAINPLEQAKELDFITPRIKKDYETILKDVAIKNQIPYIDINLPKDKDDGLTGEKYFCDYCHPIERANKIIADEIIKKIYEKE